MAGNATASWLDMRWMVTLELEIQTQWVGSIFLFLNENMCLFEREFLRILFVYEYYDCLRLHKWKCVYVRCKCGCALRSDVVVLKLMKYIFVCTFLYCDCCFEKKKTSVYTNKAAIWRSYRIHSRCYFSWWDDQSVFYKPFSFKRARKTIQLYFNTFTINNIGKKF